MRERLGFAAALLGNRTEEIAFLLGAHNRSEEGGAEENNQLLDYKSNLTTRGGRDRKNIKKYSKIFS